MREVAVGLARGCPVGGETVAKCWAVKMLEFTLTDGKAASAIWEGLGEVWRSVTVRRVAKMPGGEAVGKWRVMWGLEVKVPGREATGEHWEYDRELSTWLIGFGRLTFCLKNKHFGILAFFHYIIGVEPCCLPFLAQVFGDVDLSMFSVFELICVPNYWETLFFVQKRSNDWTIFFATSQTVHLFYKLFWPWHYYQYFFDNCNELTRVLELLFSCIIDQYVFSPWFVVQYIITRLAILKTVVSSFSNLFILLFNFDFNSFVAHATWHHSSHLSEEQQQLLSALRATF